MNGTCIASRGSRVLRIAGLLAALVVSSCAPSPDRSTKPVAEGWHEFSGSWSGSGSRRIIPLGSDRRAAIVDLSGSLLLEGARRPNAGFRADVIALNDSATGLVGRAVWTDENGDQIFSEIHGEGAATGNHLSGTFIGGTGRYAAATGGYEFVWQYVLESEDGMVEGRAVGLTGRIAAGNPAAKPSAPEERR